MLGSESTQAELCFFIGQQHHKRAQAEYDAGNYPLAATLFADTEQWYRHGLKHDPSPIPMNEALMFALISQRKHAAALPYCDKALESPDREKQIMARFTRGLTHLMVGDYPRGFADLVSRTEIKQLTDVPYFHKIDGRTPWNGKPCDHLLVYGEQGFGDIIMFSRFIPKIIGMGLAKKITVEVHESIVDLMRHNLGKHIRVEAHSDAEIVHDEFALMMNLPLIIGTTRDTIPPPNMTAPADAIAKWEKIGQLKGLKVGIVWAGRPAKDMHTVCWNAMRNIPLKTMSPILYNPHCTFVSLQKGEANNDLKNFGDIRCYDSEIKSWSDTAGIMHHLDLVISIDSGPVHLAASMGKYVWLLNHVNSCWRWQQSGPKSLWYENLRIFRQPKDGDWSTPVAEAAEQLAYVAESKPRRAA